MKIKMTKPPQENKERDLYWGGMCDIGAFARVTGYSYARVVATNHYVNGMTNFINNENKTWHSFNMYSRNMEMLIREFGLNPIEVYGAITPFTQKLYLPCMAYVSWNDDFKHLKKFYPHFTQHALVIAKGKKGALDIYDGGVHYKWYRQKRLPFLQHEQDFFNRLFLTVHLECRNKENEIWKRYKKKEPFLHDCVIDKPFGRKINFVGLDKIDTSKDRPRQVVKPT